jgi:hypothetical protein
MVNGFGIFVLMENSEKHPPIPHSGLYQEEEAGFSAINERVDGWKEQKRTLEVHDIKQQSRTVGRNLNADFKALKMRIYRKFHFNMKYWKIQTNEGNGVLNIVYRGKFVPQKWLSDA